MSDPLCIDNDMMLLSRFLILYDMIDNGLLIIIIIFRKQDIFSAIGNAAPQRDISGIPSHNLDNAAAFVGRRGIPDLIDRRHGSIHRRVKSYGIIRTCNVQIDGSRKSDGIDPLMGKLLRPTVRAVAADHDNAVDPMLPADLRSLLHTFLRLKLRASCRT